MKRSAWDAIVLALPKTAVRFALRHWLLVLFLGGGVLLVMTTNVLERWLIYFPTRDLAGDPSQLGLSYLDIRASAQDGVALHGWFIPQPGARHTLLIFHGNAGNISHRLPWLRMLHELGAHVMILDYRGYGRSQGRPSEKGLYLDARAAYDWWVRERAADKSRLVLVGESLGGAICVDLAAAVPVDGMILQSTFTNARDMAKILFPLGLLRPLAGIRFDSAAKIGNIRCPKLFIHGDRDEIVPFRLGRDLYDMAPSPKEFFEVPGAGHNDLLWTAGPAYTKRLRDFLSRIGP
jgi:fermentation-respiration switch protein FrsA (DUF1100 family)